MNISVSNICSSFSENTIGTKVIHHDAFFYELKKALQSYKWPENNRGFVSLDNALYTVSSGVAIRPGLSVSDYVLREHRGEIEMFARREHAATATALNVIVYTKDAYVGDPQVDINEAIRVKDADYVVVAVLATAGPKPQLSSHRFVRNLAGGNIIYSPEQGYTLEKAIEDAKAIVAYEKEWVTVAD